MTSALRGGVRNDDTWWQGGGGVKNCQNGGDVICGWPHIEITYAHTLLYLVVIGNEVALPWDKPAPTTAPECIIGPSFPTGSLNILKRCVWKILLFEV